jgi:type I restriction enzyme R subunit
LKLLELYLDNQESADCQQAIRDLRQQINQIPRDAFSVQQVYSQIEQAWTDGFWRYLSQRNIDFLRTQVAPLLRFVTGVEVAAATFTNKVERLKLEILTDGTKPGTLGIGGFLLVASAAEGDTGTVKSGDRGFGKSDEKSASASQFVY